MKFFTDLLPILAFFIVYKKFDIFYATAAAIIITFLQVLYSYLTSKKVEKVQIINLVVILVFGGMTILFQNETFIKWKPSVLYWVFGAILIFSKVCSQNKPNSKIPFQTSNVTYYRLGFLKCSLDSLLFINGIYQYLHCLCL